MGFQKGREKTGGRKKGTPNKATGDFRATIKDLLKNYAESGLLDSDFAELKPEQRVHYADRLANYIIPRQQSVAVSSEEEKPITIEARLKELANK